MKEVKIKKVVDRLFVAAIVTVSVIALIGLVFEIAYYGKVYPGVRIGSVNVSGLTSAQLTQRLSVAEAGLSQLKVSWGVNKWEISGSSVGLVFSKNSTANKALFFGRSGKLLNDAKNKIGLIKNGKLFEANITVDERLLDAQIQSISDQIDIPAKEPEILVENGAVKITSGENGQMVNKPNLKAKILGQARLLEPVNVAIPVAEITPKLTEAQVETARGIATAIIGKKILLEKDGENWSVEQDQLLSWIDLKTGGWSEPKIRSWIAELAITVDKPPQNATFHYVDVGRVEEFKPAKAGVKLEIDPTVDETVAQLSQLVRSGEKEAKVSLVTTNTPPDVENHEANSLGIKELIGKGESWYSGSITNRIFNLKKSAEAINGILVAPEEIFSFNGAVGEVSASTGYKQAYIIKEGKTILGDGGGVCQVSSTLFRAVLAAGLPIEERTAHAYRVHYYEEKYQPGFDATVFQPSPDFKFKNDTGAYLLIQAVYDEATKYLAFEIYGTSDGRKVEISKARIWEVTSPPPDLYQDDPTLPVGKIVQTEHAAWGAKVAFDWKVTRGEEKLQERTFYSNYKPWQAVYLRGTKPL